MLRLYVAAYLVSAPASVMAGVAKAAQAGRRYGAASWPVGEILPKRARCGPAMTAGSVPGASDDSPLRWGRWWCAARRRGSARSGRRCRRVRYSRSGCCCASSSGLVWWNSATAALARRVTAVRPTRDRVLDTAPGHRVVLLVVCVIRHGTDPSATRWTSITTSPRPTIRCTSPERAAWSDSSARRVVVSGPVVTLHSSNCARSVLPAWPRKVISYVSRATGLCLTIGG